MTGVPCRLHPTLVGASVTAIRLKTKDTRMEALTQCWFTRIHRPERARHREPDGSVRSTCRYCQRAIVSWDREAWSLSDGLDVSRLAETASGRFLTLYDTAGDFVLHRYTVSHLNDEEAITAYKQQLRDEYGLDDPDTTLELRDSQRRPAKTSTSKSRAGSKVAAGHPAPQTIVYTTETDQNL